MKRKLAGKAVIGAAALLAILGTGVANAYEFEVSDCVTDPGARGLLVGIATGLTGPVSVPIPGRRRAEYCGTLSCEAEGLLSVEPGASSFPDCEVAVTVNGSGAGSCALTVTRSTALGTRTLVARDIAISPTGPTPFPVEVCLTRTARP